MRLKDLIFKDLKERFPSIRLANFKFHTEYDIDITIHVNNERYIADILSEGIEIKDLIEEIKKKYGIMIELLAVKEYVYTYSSLCLAC
ncbi:hypothetical protein D3C87_78540 [compost metagenome]